MLNNATPQKAMTPKKADLKYSKVGVLDIGSNSVRFVIYELFGAAFTPIYNEKVLAGLGRDLSVSNRLSPAGKKEALLALRRFAMIAKTQKLDKVLIGATAALRMADDAQSFIRRVYTETGLDITPVSGDMEAKLTAQGLIAAEPRAHGIAADLGGASLELIRIKHGKPGNGISYPLGPFRVAGNNLGQGAVFDVEAMRQKIEAALDQNPIRTVRKSPLYLIGGAWRNLAGIHQRRHLYPMKTLQAYKLMPGAAKDLAVWAYGPGREDLLSWPEINQRRAETLPYSGLLMDILLERLKPSEIIISTTGLREGLVFDAMPKALKKRDALLDGCRDLARGNLQSQHFSEPLTRFLAPVDSILPATFTPDNEDRLRSAARHLAGIGKGFHPDYRAALVFDDVLYAPLSGLTHKERAYLALIVYHSYTSKTLPPNQDAINLLLTLRERQAALTYGTAIRLAVVACGRSPELLDNVHFEIHDKKIRLVSKPGYEALLTGRVHYRIRKLAELLSYKVLTKPKVKNKAGKDKS